MINKERLVTAGSDLDMRLDKCLAVRQASEHRQGDNDNETNVV